jgi:hypothetical protein
LFAVGGLTHVRPRYVAALMVILLYTLASAKDRKKVILPADVLQARTVLVVVDPDAGMRIEDPNANQAAKADVEKALQKWGRFTLVLDATNADLVITVRKGSGKMVQPTIGGVPVNDRPVVQPTDSGGRVGGRAGVSPLPGDPTNPDPRGPQPQLEVGSTEDIFVVYRGSEEDPLDAPAVWRYRAKNALQSPGVPAVNEFHKAITEAEKQQAGKP